MDGGGIRAVMARFPEQGERIRQLADQDASFHELCDDYAECLAALGRFRQQGEAARQRMDQYTELCADLECEIGRKIEQPNRDGN